MSGLPIPFRLFRIFGPADSLRCVVFHDVSPAETAFTRGLNVRISPRRFEQALSFFTRHYTPVSLQDILKAGTRGLPRRPLLVTFDDAYASVAEIAAPLCHRFGVPLMFFVNAAFLDNLRLAPPNLLCYVANVLGMDVLHRAARKIRGDGVPPTETLGQFSGSFLAAASLEQRQAFLDTVLRLAGIDERALAQEASLYITSRQLHEMAAAGAEIGNHTFSHVHCRLLTPGDYVREIDENRVRLEKLSAKRVRAFSVPYGSSVDLTADLLAHLRRSGHEAAFLSENAANRRGAGPLELDRVSTCGGGEDVLFRDIEILPRIRAIRNRLFRTPRRQAA